MRTRGGQAGQGIGLPPAMLPPYSDR